MLEDMRKIMLKLTKAAVFEQAGCIAVIALQELVDELIEEMELSNKEIFQQTIVSQIYPAQPLKTSSLPDLQTKREVS